MKNLGKPLTYCCQCVLIYGYKGGILIAGKTADLAGTNSLPLPEIALLSMH